MSKPLRALKEPTREELHERIGDPGELKREADASIIKGALGRAETVCRFCGVSYLVFSEVRSLERQLAAAKHQLSAAKQQLGRQEAQALAQRDELQSRLLSEREARSSSSSNQGLARDAEREAEREDRRQNASQHLDALAKLQAQLAAVRLEAPRLEAAHTRKLRSLRSLRAELSASVAKGEAARGQGRDQALALQGLARSAEQLRRDNDALQRCLRDLVAGTCRDIRGAQTAVTGLCRARSSGKVALAAAELEAREAGARAQKLEQRVQETRALCDRDLASQDIQLEQKEAAMCKLETQLAAVRVEARDAARAMAGQAELAVADLQTKIGLRETTMAAAMTTVNEQLQAAKRQQGENARAVAMEHSTATARLRGDASKACGDAQHARKLLAAAVEREAALMRDNAAFGAELVAAAAELARARASRVGVAAEAQKAAEVAEAAFARRASEAQGREKELLERLGKDEAGLRKCESDARLREAEARAQEVEYREEARRLQELREEEARGREVQKWQEREDEFRREAGKVQSEAKEAEKKREAEDGRERQRSEEEHRSQLDAANEAGTPAKTPSLICSACWHRGSRTAGSHASPSPGSSLKAASGRVH